MPFTPRLTPFHLPKNGKRFPQGKGSPFGKGIRTAFTGTRQRAFPDHNSPDFSDRHPAPIAGFPFPTLPKKGS